LNALARVAPDKQNIYWTTNSTWCWKYTRHRANSLDEVNRDIDCSVCCHIANGLACPKKAQCSGIPKLPRQHAISQHPVSVVFFAESVRSFFVI